MKRFLIIVILFFSLSGGVLLAQTAVDSGEQEKMLSIIQKSTSSIETLQCDFKQTKTISILDEKMISDGKMYMSHGNQLRWEYITPYQYVFILNNSRILLQNSESKNVVDLKSNRMFQEIVKIMMSSITGSSLADTDGFKVMMLKSDKEWVARLTPLKSEMKKIYETIYLHFETKNYMVNMVEMVEATGDVTYIELKNIKSNIPIDEKIFAID